LSPETLLAILHILAFVFYGGMTFQMIRDHDRRIARLEKKNDEESKIEHVHAARAGAD
jgi:hypothetical protein